MDLEGGTTAVHWEVGASTSVMMQGNDYEELDHSWAPRAAAACCRWPLRRDGALDQLQPAGGLAPDEHPRRGDLHPQPPELGSRTVDAPLELLGERHGLEPRLHRGFVGTLHLSRFPCTAVLPSASPCSATPPPAFPAAPCRCQLALQHVRVDGCQLRRESCAPPLGDQGNGWSRRGLREAAARSVHPQLGSAAASAGANRPGAR